MSDKEVGVWIVYDLEANRRIQNFLESSVFKFRFDPNLKVTNQQAKQDFIKMIDELIIEESHIFSIHKGKRGRGFKSCCVCFLC